MNGLSETANYLYNGFTSSEIAACLALPVVQGGHVYFGICGEELLGDCDIISLKIFILILAVNDPAQVLASEVDPAPHRIAGWSR